nr:hypothetical protein [uncultured Blautia sp.]
MLETLMKSPEGAGCVLKAMVKMFGVQDLIWCIYDTFCEADQQEFVRAAAQAYEKMQKGEVMN